MAKKKKEKVIEEEKITCVLCSGKGYQEETMKGYRRFVCSGCNGDKMITSYFNEAVK